VEGGEGKVGLSAKHVATIAWATARLGAPAADRRLCEVLAAAASACASDFNARDLANAMSAFAALSNSGVDEQRPDLASILCEAALARLSQFNAQELLKFAGAHARTGGRDERLHAAMGAVRTLRFGFPALPSAPKTLLKSGDNLLKSGGDDEEEGGEGGGLQVRLQSRAPGRHLKHTGVAAWEASVTLGQWLSGLPSPQASSALRAVLKSKGSAEVFEKGGKGKPPVLDILKTGWAGVICVELGAGLGLPSIVAAHRGCALVVATDGDVPTLELLTANCAANSPPLPALLRAAELRWGVEDALSACGITVPPDLLLAADVVYGQEDAEPVWRALLDSMLQLTGARTLVLQAQVQRFGREAADGCEPRFRAMLADYFESAQVSPDELAATGDVARSNCTVHALRRKPLGAGVPRTVAGGDGAGGEEGGDERARKRPRQLARVM